uniref:Secreted protein n=1 Tax=Panagrellus redivivus TaxID=6233 RepID=A0A7E4WAC9_PANRE
MAKAAAVFVVVALCALVADGQSTSGTKAFNASITPRYHPTLHPSPIVEPLGRVNVCNGEGLNTILGFPNCTYFEIKDHGCHNIPKINDKWNDLARGVDTNGQCLHLFEHVGCQGQRITVGPGCYSVGCCPQSRFLSKCNFANKLTSYMIC